jgi:hypothetical protein
MISNILFYLKQRNTRLKIIIIIILAIGFGYNLYKQIEKSIISYNIPATRILVQNNITIQLPYINICAQSFNLSKCDFIQIENVNIGNNNCPNYDILKDESLNSCMLFNIDPLNKWTMVEPQNSMIILDFIFDNYNLNIPRFILTQDKIKTVPSMMMDILQTNAFNYVQIIDYQNYIFLNLSSKLYVSSHMDFISGMNPGTFRLVIIVPTFEITYIQEYWQYDYYYIIGQIGGAISVCSTVFGVAMYLLNRITNRKIKKQYNEQDELLINNIK